MKQKKIEEFDRQWLLRSMKSTPQQRIEWLQAAHDLVRETKKALSKKKR